MSDTFKGHVPEENLFRYRALKRIANQFNSLGDTIGPNDMADSALCWKMAKKYQEKANELRADIDRVRYKEERKNG